MKIWKKMAALALAAAVTISAPLAVSAKNSWIDGNTPEKLTNRVTMTGGQIISPSVVTDFHAPELGALVPITPTNLFAKETGADISHYADAMTHVYVADNMDYGPLAKTAIENGATAIGAKIGRTFTMNLYLFEGGVYKARESTVADMEFMIEIPKDLRANFREFAVLRVNADGTVSYLTDWDTDARTLTFKTNYFKAYSLYCLIYGPAGCFDAYKPQPEPAVQPQTAAK